MRDAAIDLPRSSGRNGGRIRPSGAPPLDGLVDERPAARGRRSAAVRVGGVVTSAAIAAQRLGGRRAGTAAGRSAPGLWGRLTGGLPRVRPLKVLTVAVFSASLIGIVANAMVFQRGRHPAPLFGLGQPIDGVPDRLPVADAPPPAPVPIERTGSLAPAPMAPSAPVVAPAPAAEVAPRLVATKSAPSHHLSTKPHHVDGIAGLLKSGSGGASAHPRPGSLAAKSPAAPSHKAEAPTHHRVAAAPADRTSGKAASAPQ